MRTNSGNFLTMPSCRRRTVRPAKIKKGRLLPSAVLDNQHHQKVDGINSQGLSAARMWSRIARTTHVTMPAETRPGTTNDERAVRACAFPRTWLPPGSARSDPSASSSSRDFARPHRANIAPGVLCACYYMLVAPTCFAGVRIQLSYEKSNLVCLFNNPV